MRVTCDHIHLRSPDPDAAAKTYVAFFDATVKSRTDADDRLRVVVDLGGLLLLIDRVPPQTQHAPPIPFVGIEHIGLQVADVDAATEELRRKGAKVLVEPNSPRPDIRIAFVEGPDAVRIEILQRGA
jgi:lactoylglutathione lyase